MTEGSKAFFSYSRADGEFALKLAKDLRNAGASIWIDQLDIAPGAHWDITIQKAVGTSSSLLVVLSPHSVESENVMDEVAYAIEEKKLVIPVLYRRCDIPLRLRRLQYIDVETDYEAGLNRIVTQLQAHQNSAQSSADPPARATTAEWNLAEARAKAQAREREEAAKAADVRAAQERIARENAQRVAGQQAAQQLYKRPAAAPPAAPPDAMPAARPGSSKKVIWAAVGGSIVVLLLIALIANMLSHRTEQTQKASSSASSSGGQTSSEGDKRPDLHRWLQDALSAMQGPSVDALRPYFDETVSPYYSMPSAGWNEIAADKRAYFQRFSQIHYELLMWQHIPQSDGSEQIECDVRYSAVRNDGVPARGAAHYVMRVRFRDGAWKITSVRSVPVTS